MAIKNPRRTKQFIQNVATRVFSGHPAQPIIPTRLSYRAPADVSTLPTGLRPLDKALGIGGLPCGKITELIGSGAAPISNGVTNVAARIGSKTQRQQRLVTIIDMCHSFDPWQAERCGLIAPHLLLTRPDTVFAALTTLEGAARSEGLVIVVLGAVTAILDHADPDLLKTLLRRLQSIVRQSDSVFLLITTPNDNDPFNPTNYPFGFPLAELADIRLWVQDENWTFKDSISTAYRANLTVIKNRLAVAGTGADIRIKFS